MSFLRTVVLMVAAAGLAIIIGWSYAFCTERCQRRATWAWRLVPLISISLPLCIHAAAWESTLGKFGWLRFGQVASQVVPFAGMGAAIWIHGMSGSAWVALIVARFMRRGVSPAEQASYLDVGIARTAFFITLPATLSITFAAGSWVMLLSATDISVVNLYMVRTLADDVYFIYATNPQFGPVLIATLVPAAIVAAALAVIYRSFIQGKDIRSQLGAKLECRSQLSTTGRIQLTTRMIAFGGTFAMLALPIASLSIKAGWLVQRRGDGVDISWSSLQFTRTIYGAAVGFSDDFLWTGVFILLVAVLSLPLCVGMYLLSKRYLLAILGFNLFMILIPGSVVATFVIYACTNSGASWLLYLYRETLLPTAVSILPKTVGVGTLVMLATATYFPKQALQASRLEGASTVQQFWWIEWPLLLPGVAISGYLSALIALGDVSATHLVHPPRVSLISGRLFSLLHSGVRYQESGLCLLATACVTISTLIAVVIASRINRLKSNWVIYDEK